MIIKMLYPTQQNVSEDQIRSLLADAIANEEVDSIGGEYPDPKTVSLDEAIRLLSDKFTFERWW